MHRFFVSSSRRTSWNISKKKDEERRQDLQFLTNKRETNANLSAYPVLRIQSMEWCSEDGHPFCVHFSRRRGKPLHLNETMDCKGNRDDKELLEEDKVIKVMLHSSDQRDSESLCRDTAQQFNKDSVFTEKWYTRKCENTESSESM